MAQVPASSPRYLESPVPTSTESHRPLSDYSSISLERFPKQPQSPTLAQQLRMLLGKTYRFSESTI